VCNLFNRLRKATQISNLKRQSAAELRPHMSKAQVDMDGLFQRVVSEHDQEAFELIFDATYTMLCGISSRMTKRADLAEEIVDDVFYSFWKNREKITINTSFTPYLVAAVRNRSLDYLRRIKTDRSSTLDVASDIASPETIASDTMAYEELKDHITSAIQSLPPQCKLIFTLSREQELTYKEISIRLGLSIKTVDTQMGRALKHLRNELTTFGL
jgi:RNA polymerase sigma-70 factor (family 1)